MLRRGRARLHHRRGLAVEQLDFAADQEHGRLGGLAAREQHLALLVGAVARRARELGAVGRIQRGERDELAKECGIDHCPRQRRDITGKGVDKCQIAVAGSRKNPGDEAGGGGGGGRELERSGNLRSAGVLALPLRAPCSRCSNFPKANGPLARAVARIGLRFAQNSKRKPTCTDQRDSPATSLRISVGFVTAPVDSFT